MVAASSSTWIAIALVFLAVVFGVVAMVTLVEGAVEGRRRKDVLKQLQRLDEEMARGPQQPAGSVLRASAAEKAAWLEDAMDRLPLLGRVEQLIQQSALSWTLQGYLTRTGGFALALGLGGLVAFGLGLAPVILAAVGAFLPYLHLKRRASARLNKFEEQLPDAIDLIGRAIRAGHPLSSGLRMVADEGADPVAGEFRLVAEEQRFGMPFEDSLVALADRVPLVDVRILVTAVLIQREVGGNLAEILDNLAHIIRQRFTIRRQLRVITAEGRMSMWVLMGLPIGVGLMILVLNPEYMMTLFRDPIGHMMLYAAVVMQFLGFLWIRKIVDLKI